MRELIRGLNFTGATALVAGSMIGTGVFFKAAIMSQQVGSPVLVLAAWLVAGLMSLAGALTYAELGAMLPQAGGEYNYLRAAYGTMPAFLDGWMRAVVASAGVAALGAGFATFLSALVPMNAVWASTTLHIFGRALAWQLGVKELVAVAMIFLFGVANCAGVAFGGRVQTALTGAKVLGIVVIIGGAYFFSSDGTFSNVTSFNVNASTGRFSGLTAFGAAVLSALWACDGWAFMPMVAGEIKNPARNVPRALFVGVLGVLGLYALVNLAYFYALPFDQVAASNSTLHRDALPVASRVAQTFLGSRGPALLSVLCLISVAGAMNGVILALARMPFAMSRDGLLGRIRRSVEGSACAGVVRAGDHRMVVRSGVVGDVRSTYRFDYFRAMDFLWAYGRGGDRAAAQDAGCAPAVSYDFLSGYSAGVCGVRGSAGVQ